MTTAAAQPSAAPERERRIPHVVKIDRHLAECFYAIVPKRERSDFVAEALSRIMRCSQQMCNELSLVRMELHNLNAPADGPRGWPLAEIRISLPASLRSEWGDAWPQLFDGYKRPASIGVETALIWLLNERHPVPLRSWYSRPHWFALPVDGVAGRIGAAKRAMIDEQMAKVYADGLRYFADPTSADARQLADDPHSQEAEASHDDDLMPAEKALALKLSTLPEATRRAVMELADEYADECD